MAINWNFNEEEANIQSFTLIPEGRHLCRIDKVEERTSKSGYPQIKLELSVSGYSSHVWDYITFNQDQSQQINKKLGSIFQSFGLPHNLNTAGWVGKVGGVCIKHELYEGEKSAKVRYFCEKPAGAVWKNPDGSTGGVQPLNIQSDDLPF